MFTSGNNRIIVSHSRAQQGIIDWGVNSRKIHKSVSGKSRRIGRVYRSLVP